MVDAIYIAGLVGWLVFYLGALAFRLSGRGTVFPLSCLVICCTWESYFLLLWVFTGDRFGYAGIAVFAWIVLTTSMILIEFRALWRRGSVLTMAIAMVALSLGNVLLHGAITTSVEGMFLIGTVSGYAVLLQTNVIVLANVAAARQGSTPVLALNVLRACSSAAVIFWDNNQPEAGPALLLAGTTLVLVDLVTLAVIVSLRRQRKDDAANA